MARQPTLVQLSDHLLALLDQRAARAGRSRSELIREAIELYVSNDRAAEIDAAIVAGYQRIPAEPPEAWAEASAIEAIRAEPW
jgi:metal-responsive CopG/Arc/MetJ family transcriptional regulator